LRTYPLNGETVAVAPLRARLCPIPGDKFGTVTRFDRDTAVTPAGSGAYGGVVDEGWWIQRGPNGGYLAAMLLRALTAAVDDPTRHARSLTIHYAAAPAAGPVQIDTVVERTGRSLTTVTARLSQDGRLCAIAIAAFATERDSPVAFADAPMPDVGSPDDPPVLSRPRGASPTLSDRFDQRITSGGPFLSGDPAVSGGWIRLEEPRVMDAPLAALYMDAWLPPVFIRAGVLVGVPTIDLTVHFLAPLPLADLDPAAHLAVRFESRIARGGFVEEDGELWSPDGTLLAKSRQLALIIGMPPG
jgi:acyl-CoA thioesterase